MLCDKHNYVDYICQLFANRNILREAGAEHVQASVQQKPDQHTDRESVVLRPDRGMRAPIHPVSDGMGTAEWIPDWIQCDEVQHRGDCATSTVSIHEVLAFLAASVAAGTLDSSQPGAPGSCAAFRILQVVAGGLIEDSQDATGCKILQLAHSRTDGVL